MLVLAKANPVIKTEILQTPLTYIVRIWLFCSSFRQKKRLVSPPIWLFSPWCLCECGMISQHCSSFPSISSIIAALQVKTDAPVCSPPGVQFLHAKGPFAEKLIAQRRLQPWAALGENIARVEWKLHFAGANISPGLWKIPFKWSQAEKKQGICLAFCSTGFSTYTSCFISHYDLWVRRRVPGTEMWW